MSQKHLAVGRYLVLPSQVPATLPRYLHFTCQKSELTPAAASPSRIFTSGQRVAGKSADCVAVLGAGD